jgi:S1-C subfamily serine protease
VSKVDRGGEAERAGVMVNDLIILYHGRDVTDRKTLDALIKESKGTESVTFSLVRNGQIVVLNIKGGVFGGSYQDAVR